jgi:serine/threonine protein kinase
MPRGVNLDYNFGEDCRIEYFDPVAVKMVPPVRHVSDLVMKLDGQYEEFEGEDKGSGNGSSIVKFMRHRVSGAEIAVKEFLVKSDRVQKDFLSEIEALKKLNHPCIVQLKGCCLPSGTESAKIVMEYVGGGTLKNLLRTDIRPPRWWTATRKAITIAGIVLGMKYIHSEGFIHRDLKPTNILLDDDRDVKISEFGSSRLYQADSTMTGAGTPLYMAPEVDEGHYDGKVDVYSFGIIVYEIVSGNGIFSNDGNKFKLFGMMQSGKRPDIPDFVLPFSRELIEKCWSEEASNRPSFSEIWRKLEEAEFKFMEGVDSHAVKGWWGGIEEKERVLGIKRS